MAHDKKKLWKKEPTNKQVQNTPCYRCGNQSSTSWYICSLGGYGAVCTNCDILLNQTVLIFMQVPDWTSIIVKYGIAERKKSATPVAKS